MIQSILYAESFATDCSGDFVALDYPLASCMLDHFLEM